MTTDDIPILTITEGWTIDQVQTIQDCDDADALLTQVIAEIEGQLLADKAEGFARGIAWRTKANIALKMKRRAMQQVAAKRGAINREARSKSRDARDRDLLNIVKRDYPEQFQAAVSTFIAERGGPAHG